MKFGQVENPDEVDFTIPPDHPDTKKNLAKGKGKGLEVYVGCAKWSSAELKNFYPKGTRDELAYYSSQFNSIELNATFRKRYFAPQYEKWANATPEGFKPTARFQVFGPKSWTAPVLANGLVYCRNQRGELVAINLK